MKKITLIILTLFIAINSFAQSRGMKEVAETNLGNQVNIGKQYALFIAIDAYRQWTPLKKPVSDAKEIRDILKTDYYIDEVIELYNAQATKQNIIKTFTDLQKKIGVHDSLFIYYAGHGYLEEGSKTGFWIPVDGGTDITLQDNWIANHQIRGYIAGFKTIHVFMVSDSCFSGDILNASRSAAPQINNEYFRRGYSLTSRQVMTSGASEQVPDQSEFSSAFINTLRKNTNPLIDPLSIYNDIRLSVKSTMPMLGALSGANHQENATFIFFRRQNSVAVTPTPQPSNVPSNMVLINGGTFTMGSPVSEMGRDKNEVQHRVTVSNFYMGKYLVTQKEWNDIMGTTVRQRRSMVFNIDMAEDWLLERTLFGEGDNYPMYYVSWYNAIEYCNKRSQIEGLTPVYSIDKRNGDQNRVKNFGDEKWVVTWNRNANGYRLPTEAEWEYACRAGTTTAYNTGENINSNTGWYEGNSGGKTHEVGKKQANTWGIYDMHGNVWEWCWDWYGDYINRAQTDPIGPSSGNERVIRGGSQSSDATILRSAFRTGDLPIGIFDAGPDRGFRLVRNAL